MNILWSRAIRFSLTFALVMIVAQTVGLTGTRCAGNPLKLTVLYMNDPHAHYVPYSKDGSSEPIGGFGKASAIISEIRSINREQGRNTLVLLAGDLLMGTPFSTAFKGKLGVTLMNAMQFDAMVVGNHEFDYGKDNLLSNVKSHMNLPLLSANIRTRAGDFLFERVLVKDIPDSRSRIFIVGLTTQETPITTFPENVKDLVFEDPVKTAQEVLQGVEDQDLVIALTHLGVEEDKRLAQSCPKISIIIGGHSHTMLSKPMKVNDTIICQAGAYAEYLGKLDVDVQDGKVIKYHAELIHLGTQIKEDPAITATINQFKSLMDSNLNMVIGRTEVTLEGGRRAVRSGHGTNLGRLIGYNMAMSMQADAALINGGAIRASLKEGEITLEEVYTVLPFSDTVVKIDLAGADIEEAFQKSAGLPEGSGGKLQSFGIEFTGDSRQPKIKKIGAHDFRPEMIYSLATNNFLVAGGDGYTIFKEKGLNVYDSSVLISDLMVNFIRERENITHSLLESIEIGQ